VASLRARIDASPTTPRQSNPTPPLTPGTRPTRPIYCLSHTLTPAKRSGSGRPFRAEGHGEAIRARVELGLSLPAGRPWSQSTVFHRFLIHRRTNGSGKSPRSEGRHEVLRAFNVTKHDLTRTEIICIANWASHSRQAVCGANLLTSTAYLHLISAVQVASLLALMGAMNFFELEMTGPKTRLDDDTSIANCASPSHPAVGGANVLSSTAFLHLIEYLAVASLPALRDTTKFFELEVTGPQTPLARQHIHRERRLSLPSGSR
jgi:hypothetical protein